MAGPAGVTETTGSGDGGAAAGDGFFVSAMAVVAQSSITAHESARI